MHITYVIAPGGGPEGYVKTILPWLRNHGHRVSVIYTVDSKRVPLPVSADTTVYAPSGSWHYYLAKIIGNWHAVPRRLRQWESAQAVYRVLEQIDAKYTVDVVEVVEGLPVTQLCKRWSIVVRAHGADWTFRCFCKDGDSSADKWLVADQSKQFHQVHGIAALSNDLARHLAEALEFPLDKVFAIPYPIDTDQFCPPNPKSIGSPQSLLCIGRIERRKGTDILVRALNLVWKTYPDLCVTLLGSEGDLSRQALLTLVPADKRTQIIFPGFVERAQLPRFYQQTSLYIAPTMYETFGYTVLEAMACGVPVIASDVGAISELVENNVTGLLVPFGDVEALAKAILMLLGNPELYEKMGNRAREKAVHEFRLENVMSQLIDFYTKKY